MKIEVLADTDSVARAAGNRADDKRIKAQDVVPHTVGFWKRPFDKYHSAQNERSSIEPTILG
jgi:hypothetical protein